ncbi:hypothetical protein HPB49_011817 [Dermacentor silvarum]|uniref:Uncharacterized protein n=1 Tax=Dermacentor silvarum TaxID=543639 RepID=A0ACB8CX80_DERSI|nr:hypothetical protein HPB49_011817 [Dermacentor silvarum]
MVRKHLNELAMWASTPTNAAADDLIGAIEETTGLKSLKSLQYQGGTKFSIAVASAAAAPVLLARGSFVLYGESVPVVQAGPQVVAATVFRSPLFVRDASLAAAISPYGKVLKIHEQSFKGRQHVGNSLRMVGIEMLKPVPNFMTAHGHRIMYDYRGVTKEGHVGKECNKPGCARCEVFGHETTDFFTPRRRCAEEHVTAGCLRPRSYAFAAGTAPAERTQASAAVDEPRAAFSPPLKATEETEPGNCDCQQATTPTEEGRTGPDASAPSFTAEQNVATPKSASQFSVSQDSSGDPENTDVPATKYENRPWAPSYSEAAAMRREGQDAKQTRGPAGRGHGMQTLDTRKRQPPAEAPGSAGGPDATEPHDPSLRNPVSQVSDLLGLSDDMLVDKLDLKRPLLSTSSSADDSAISISSRRLSCRAPPARLGPIPRPRSGRSLSRRLQTGL